MEIIDVAADLVVDVVIVEDGFYVGDLGIK